MIVKSVLVLKNNEMKNQNKTRRDFIKKSAVGALGLSLPFTAKSYNRIIGSNERVNFAVAGINSRGKAHIRAIAAGKNTAITYLCDVDTRTYAKGKELMSKMKMDTKIKTENDFRKILEDKDVDAVSIATPDHLHAGQAIWALAAGKDVYVEKPCSHNPHEGELLVQAQKKYGKVCQMGNQQRSAPTSQMAVQDIKDGLIGEVYYGKAWYSNKRGPIGKGKISSVPDWLDWDLWQGVAPRRTFQDIYVHYNWHWFWHWGTGEVNNNGAHEIDVCRWALGVDYPVRVISAGGRFNYEDDWEFYDTQNVTFEFENGKMITWEGRSCNTLPHYDRGRGSTIHGSNGSMLLDRNVYIAYDKNGKVIKEVKEKEMSATTNTVGAGGLDVYHMNNFLDAIREGAEQNSPIDEGHKSVLLCHLGNMAQETGKALKVDPNTGRVLNSKKAMNMWSREYEKGWEPTV